jgi:hypothetical protein
MPGDNRAAVVHLSDDKMPIMCTIADISESGAGLITIGSLEDIPERFQLEIKGESTLRWCKVVWKKEQYPYRLGVSFE